MTELSLSQTVIDKIRADKRMLEDARGLPLRPTLAYYMRCHSTDQDGRTIEHGDGFNLVFRPATEPVENDCLVVNADEDTKVFVRIAGLELRGPLLIDYADRAFFAKPRP